MSTTAQQVFSGQYPAKAVPTVAAEPIGESRLTTTGLIIDSGGGYP